ncbi:MAG TPA: hypothetical protein VFQ42_15740 [Mycobacterium sp.]|nr:hypothetical protein [Mycobacterium sp.]
MRELSVAEQRYQAVMAVVGDGLSISQVADCLDYCQPGLRETRKPTFVHSRAKCSSRLL